MTCPNCKLTSEEIGVGTITRCEGKECFYHPEGETVKAFVAHVKGVGLKTMLKGMGYDKPDIDEVVTKIMKDE